MLTPALQCPTPVPLRASSPSLEPHPIGTNEDALVAGKREFFEETGFQVSGQYEPLGTFRQNGKKELTIWVLEGDVVPHELKSNSFSMVWPPNFGRHREFTVPCAL